MKKSKPKKTKYEAKVYIGKEIYQNLSNLVHLGVFSSVPQALGVIIRSEDFKSVLNVINSELSKYESELAKLGVTK